MKNMTSLPSMRKVLLLSASFLLFFNACKKDGDLTPDFVENTSSVAFTDSLSVSSVTVNGKAVLADNIAIGLSGIYQDSIFGKSIASFYVQPLLPTNSLVFGESNETLLADSIILSLEYSGFYGDTTASQTLQVFRLSEKLDKDERYPSDTSIQHFSTPIGAITFTPSPKKRIRINQPNSTGGTDTVEVSPQIRIKLDNAFATELLGKSGGSELLNNDNFTDFFKGLKVTPLDQGGTTNNKAAILYFALTSSNTELSVYYRRVKQNGDIIKAVTDFPINSSSVRFNTFQHDYSSGIIENKLNDSSSVYLYTQAMAGVETTLKFNKVVDALKEADIILNKAELELPVASGNVLAFGTASKIILASRDENDDLQFIPDFFESESYFGGDFDEEKNWYRFNITRYVQGLLNGSENKKGLTVLVTGSAVKAERAVFLNESAANGTRIKLNLYYSNTQ